MLEEHSVMDIDQTTTDAPDVYIASQVEDIGAVGEYATSLTSAAPPISRIPVELLIEILAWIPRLHGHSVLWRNNDCGPPWVSVTCVCRYWRRVALESRDLWTNIPLASLRWTEIALQRSNPAPITLALDTNLHSLSCFYESVPRALQELFRLKSLSVVYSQEDIGQEAVAQIINHLSSAPAPTLEELFLHFPIGGDAPFQLPNDIFAGVAPPNLRRLSIFGCRLSTTSPVLRAPLRSLEINQNCLVWFTIDQAIETLSVLSTLEELRIDCSNVLLNPRVTQNHRRHCVQLPHLKRLVLSDNFTQSLVLCRYLRIPLTATIDIRSSYQNEIPQTDHPMLEEVLKYHFSAAVEEDTAFSHILFERGSGSMHMECDGLREDSQPWRAYPFIIPPPIDGIPCAPIEDPREFSFSVPVDWAEPAIVSTLFKVPVFKNCPHLMVKEPSNYHVDQSPPDPAFWEFFSEFKEVKELEVFNRAAYSLVEALDAPEPPMLFPKLERLVIRDVNFAGWRRTGEASYSQISFFSCLLTALDARLESTTVTPLKVVHIADCDVEPRMIKVLQKVLGEVKLDWDGKEMRIHAADRYYDASIMDMDDA